MNYKKLWNDLKEDMILSCEKSETDYTVGLIQAREILMNMVKAEVAETRKYEEMENNIDMALANLLKGENA